MLVTIISRLYAVVGLISVMGYAPQIRTLLQGAKAPTEISVKTWTIWMFEGMVSLSYGIVCLHDFMFCLLMAVDVVCMAVIIGLVLNNRYVKYGSCDNFPTAFLLYYFRRPFFAMSDIRDRII